MKTTQTPEQIQAAYYEKTAAFYDDAHMSNHEDSEHYVALDFIDALSRLLNLHSFLDVGAGTGRGVRYLLAKGKYNIRGVEPVGKLIEQGEQKGVPKGLIVEGSGTSLPFEDNSFDAVFECGVLHHVAQPDKVVAEMMRVAQKAVFLSDSNRFGQGRGYAVRLLKLTLYKAHLWNTARYLQTRGRMFSISEGDGLFYSYSVFDSYHQLAKWADKIWILPTSSNLLGNSWLNPLTTSSHVLLCAMKRPQSSESSALQQALSSRCD